jgi:hypothetical protein
VNSKDKKKFSIMGLLSSSLCNMAELPKKMLKYSTPAALCLIALGTALYAINKLGSNYSSVFEFTSTSLITNSFFVLAEFIIASLVIDILIRKRSE